MSFPRHASLGRRLALALVGVALILVLLLAGVNYAVARSLLDRSLDSQLTALRDARIQAIDRGLERVEARVANMAREPGVVDALTELSAGYDALREDISAGEVASIESRYQAEVLDLYEEAGVDHPPAASLVPASVAGRALQSLYLDRNPFPADRRQELDDAGDGSDYSAAHLRHHPYLRQLRATTGVFDLALVSSRNLDVVYSVSKRIDIGTDIVDGPYRDTGLSESFRRLSRVPVGDAVVVDFEFYLPDASTPTLFVAAAVRSESAVIGALVAQVSIEDLTDLTTAGQQWDLLGLGRTGETYVVGSDLLLRSNSRLWLQDSEEYLRRFAAQGYPDDVAKIMRLIDSPVLLQTVDNEAVVTALEGDDFVGTVKSYLGDSTLTAAAPVQVGGLGWVVVAEQATSETGDSLATFVRRVAVVLAILLPAIALLGAYLARVFTRPIEPLVGAASRIAEGNLDTDLPDLGRNELGDLSRQLEDLASQLRKQDEAIAEEEQRIEDMLGAVLPPRLIDRVRRGEREIADVLDTATVISMTVLGLPDPSGPDQDTVFELTSRVMAEIDRLMSVHGIERVRSSSDHLFFLAGLGSPDAKADKAVRFTLAVADAISRAGVELGVDIATRSGLAAGEVATGVFGTTQVSFGVWGDPPGIAVALDSMATRGELLADRTVIDSLVGTWTVTPVQGVVGLADEVIEAYSVAPIPSAVTSGEL